MPQEVNLPAAELKMDDHMAPRASGVQSRRPSAMAVRVAAGLAVAVVLVIAFTRLVNLSSAFQRLAHLEIGPAIACGIVFLAAYAVRGLRWRYLLAPERVSRSRAVAIYQVATFVNWLLPIQGGELVKCLLLRRLQGTPISRSLPTVVMDKAMDLLPAVGLLALLPFLPFHLSRPLWILLLTVLLVLAGCALFLGLAIWRRSVALALLCWLMQKLPTAAQQRLEPFAIKFTEALLALAMRPRVLLIAAGYTVVAVCCDALSFLLAFQAVGASIAFPVVLYGYTFYNLAYILPTPPGHIGLNEVVGLLVFTGLLHISSTTVAAVFLFVHPWTAILMTTCGLLCLSAMGLTLRSTLALTHEAPQESPRKALQEVTS
jgi:uncharacterized protein (TIRG00374 family)